MTNAFLRSFWITDRYLLASTLHDLEIRQPFQSYFYWNIYFGSVFGTTLSHFYLWLERFLPHDVVKIFLLFQSPSIPMSLCRGQSQTPCLYIPTLWIYCCVILRPTVAHHTQLTQQTRKVTCYQAESVCLHKYIHIYVSTNTSKIIEDHKEKYFDYSITITLLLVLCTSLQLAGHTAQKELLKHRELMSLFCHRHWCSIQGYSFKSKI